MLFEELLINDPGVNDFHGFELGSHHLDLVSHQGIKLVKAEVPRLSLLRFTWRLLVLVWLESVVLEVILVDVRLDSCVVLGQSTYLCFLLSLVHFYNFPGAQNLYLYLYKV